MGPSPESYAAPVFMRRLTHLLAPRLLRVFSLSPASRAFFWASAALHVLFKVLLGLTLVFEDGYGLRSMLAPPQSLIFASTDVLTCFVVAKLLDPVVGARFARAVHGTLLALLGLFLVANFIVHGYFKSFVNSGLLEFNGASTVELYDYTAAGMTRWAVAMSLCALLAVLSFVTLHGRWLRTRLVSSERMPMAALVLSGAAMAYAYTLSSGQSGWIRRNPAYELVRSFEQSKAQAVNKIGREEARAFGTPKPLYGRYDSSLNVRVPSQRGKNVLFVLIESLPLEQTPLGGEPSGLTVLSELAQHGVSFTNFRTVFPATSRSFLTYHCGIYPTTGPATVTKYTPGYRCDSLLSSLEQRGYRTGFFTAPMFTYDNLHKAAVTTQYDVYEDHLSLSELAHTEIDAPAVPEEVVAERVHRFTRESAGKPWFATYFMFWNHAPYRLPNEDISHLPLLARYRRTLTYLDGVLRDLLAKLEADGVLDDTLVVVAADHGEGFELHHDNRSHVGHLYEDDVRIPLLIHVPGLGKHEVARSGSNVDFAPTLAAMLGLDAAPSWQGQDLLSESYEARPTLLFGRSAFSANAIVDGNYKYIEYPDSEQRMLFDLGVDPHEQNNLLAREPDKADAYRKLVERWLPVVDHHAWAIHSDRRSSARAAR